jgi:hypothetical protein
MTTTTTTSNQIKLTDAQSNALKDAYRCYLAGEEWKPFNRNIKSPSVAKLFTLGLVESAHKWDARKLTNKGITEAQNRFALIWWEDLMVAVSKAHDQAQRDRAQNALRQRFGCSSNVTISTSSQGLFLARYESGVQIYGHRFFSRDLTYRVELNHIRIENESEAIILQRDLKEALELKAKFEVEAAKTEL